MGPQWLADVRCNRRRWYSRPSLVSGDSALPRERLGFEVHWTESDERDAQIFALVGVVLNRAEYGQVVVLTGDRSLVDQLPRSVEVCKTIAEVPALDQR